MDDRSGGVEAAVAADFCFELLLGPATLLEPLGVGVAPSGESDLAGCSWVRVWEQRWRENWERGVEFQRHRRRDGGNSRFSALIYTRVGWFGLKETMGSNLRKFEIKRVEIDPFVKAHK